MKTFYFTFGKAHPYHDQCQQIVAMNITTAKEQMSSIFGENWDKCYTQIQFETLIRNGRCSKLVPLPPIYKREII
jgi:hypothetical protein